MSSLDELRELQRQWGEPSLERQIEAMEEYLEAEAAFRQRVIHLVIRAMIYAARAKRANLTITYRDPSEDQEKAISVIEGWLSDEDFAFDILTTEEERKEIVQIIIML